MLGFLITLGIGILLGWIIPQPEKAKPVTDWIVTTAKKLWVKATSKTIDT